MKKKLFIKVLVLIFSVVSSCEAKTYNGKVDNLSKPFVQNGHFGRITSLTLSPNSRYLLSSSRDNRITLWDVATGRELKSYEGHSDYVRDIKFIDNNNFLSASQDAIIKLWNIDNGEKKYFFGHRGGVRSLNISKNKKRFISTGGDGKIIIWNIKNGNIEHFININRSSVNDAIYANEDNTIYSINTKKTIQVYDKLLKNKIDEYYIHEQTKKIPYDIAINDNSTFMATCDSENIYLWKLNSQSKRARIVKQIAHNDKYSYLLSNTIYSLDFSPDGNQLAFGGSRGFLAIYDIKLNSYRKLKTNTLENITSVIFGKDNKNIFVGYKSGLIEQYNTQSGKSIKFFKSNISRINAISLREDILSVGTNSKVILYNLKKLQILNQLKVKKIISSMVFDKEKLYFTYEDSESIKITDVPKFKKIKSIRNDMSLVNEIKLDTINKNILVAGNSKWIHQYSLKNGRFTGDYQSLDRPVFSFDFNRKTNYILIGSKNGLLTYSKIIKVKNGNEVGESNHQKSTYKLKGHTNHVTQVKISSYGKFAITSSYDKTILWNLNTKKIIRTLSNKGQKVNNVKLGESVAFSADNKYVIFANKHKLHFVELDNIYKSFTINNVFNNVTFNIAPINNQYILVSSYTGDMTIYDIKSKRVLVSLLILNNGWLMITPEGYFTGSKNAVQYLNMTKTTKNGLEPFDFSQLYDHFFRPDLVKLKLSGYEEAYQKVIGGMTYQEALKNPPPKLSFKSIDNKKTKLSSFSYDDVNISKEKVKLSFNIKEHDNGGIGLIRIYQEGKLIQTIGEGKINKQSANVYTILEQEQLDKKQKVNQDNYLAMNTKKAAKYLTGDFNMSIEDTIAKVKSTTTKNKAGTYNLEIELKSGKNEISIEAFNKTNTVTSYRENITINADIPKHKPKLYAIVAGINNFQTNNKKYKLNYSENDAKAIKEVAQKQMGTLFDKVEVEYLIGNDVTKENILNAVHEISKKVKLTDTVLFYISTHGRAFKGKLYLLPYNNDKLKNYIDFEQTFKAVQSIKALNQIFIIDACESGKANDIVSSVYDSRASVLAKSSGVHVFLATTKGTSAFESSDPKIKNGMFTYKILQALKNKATDENNDSIISILELSKKLKELSNNVDYQYPVIRNVGSDIQLEKIK